ncbi:MAG: CCA tRNA nucleotidyltransferase [Clostridia bacterium]|nr:CCA tRNA nucleotidyltransferase [Clostridia bacterium]
MKYNFDISYGASYVLDTLHKKGYEAYVVGGSVRDMYLGKRAHDYDITTSATPEETRSVFYDLPVIETGIKHGTVTVIVNSESIEITTYRCDGEYTDSRHPDSVEFTRNLSDDLCRRDFTINALAYDGEGEIIDLHGGREDIENRVVRAIGNPYKRFTEDALRILRGMRFSSVLGFEIEERTRQAILDLRHLLKKISKERIAEEINKLLCGKNAREVILSYSEVLGEIIPEINIMRGFDQKNRHHIYDILTHTAYVVSNTEPEKHLRLAALLHDSGKPETVSTDENGEQHFYGHPHASEEIARRFLNEYKYDNATKDRVLLLVRVHDTVIDEDKVYIKKRLNRMGKDAFFELVQLQRADNKAQNPIYDRTEHFDRVEEIARQIISESECFSLKDLSVNGRDLMENGFSRGKLLGEILDYLLKCVIEEKTENNKEALLRLAREQFGG